jgi:aspartate/methionine/tyrosine aminotransferase
VATMASSSNENGKQVKESVIRMMTRLAVEFDAVNLSQGFPNEGPPWEMRLALAHGVLNGYPTGQSGMDEDTLKKSLVDMILSDTASREGKLDQLNQYSPPMGRQDLRQAISDYYQRFYQYNVSPDDITVTLGATEAFASALRTIGRPGDKCVIIEPFHELYPSQCNIFYLEKVYVTLRMGDGQWELDFEELEEALRGSKILMLNSPHNPTGKVFKKEELAKIVKLCLKYDVYIITDEIYEHMIYDGTPHFLLPKEFPEITNRTLVCNSIGKSASATGWRLGWCLHPPHVRDTYRAIHDQMTVMSPHPMQHATMTYLQMPDAYFGNLSERYKRRVQTLGNTLSEIGFQVVMPQGAYYLFVDYRQVNVLKGMDAMEATMYLLKNVGVACVPGSNFYGNKDSPEARKYLRFAACRSDADLEEASKRLRKLM